MQLYIDRGKTTNLSFLPATAESATVSLASFHLVVNLLKKNTGVADDDEGRGQIQPLLEVDDECVPLELPDLADFIVHLGDGQSGERGRED